MSLTPVSPIVSPAATALSPASFGDRIRRFALRSPEHDARLNIMHGSVRSGKTWALFPKIMWGTAYPVKGWRVLTGVSKNSIYNNVLHDLLSILGPSRYSYNRQTGLLQIARSNWLVIGGKDEGSEKYIRGLTVGYVVGDELTLIPEEFFQMLLTRMSPEGARLYATTNPDNPMHWLKKDFIDNERLRKQGLIYTLHTTMSDNPNLSPAFIAEQKLLYTGAFYQRYIEGQWVVAEGAIYRDAWSDELLYSDVTRPIGLKGAGGFVDRWIAVDCGVDHPQVYLEFYDDGKVIWCEREYYWDSRAERRQKTDREYADDLAAFMGLNNACAVIIPPEAASFRAELIQRGIFVKEANNEVLPGIQTVSALMSTRKLMINQQHCPQLLRTIPIYRWNEKKAINGVEEPVKQDDDAVDALRYGLHGKIPRYRLSF